MCVRRSGDIKMGVSFVHLLPLPYNSSFSFWFSFKTTTQGVALMFPHVISTFRAELHKRPQTWCRLVASHTRQTRDPLRRPDGPKAPELFDLWSTPTPARLSGLDGTCQGAVDVWTWATGKLMELCCMRPRNVTYLLKTQLFIFLVTWAICL